MTKKERKEYVCPICGKEFDSKHSLDAHKGWHTNHREAWNKGLTKETDERVAKNTKHMVGESNPMKQPGARVRHSIVMKEVGKRPEVKANRSAVQKLIQKEIHSRPEYRAKVGHKGEKNGMFGVHRFGEDAPGWKGGPALGNYPLKFNMELKEFIRKRDNNTCQLCSKLQKEEGRKLGVHHINYVKDDLFELNLITLCRSCNSKVNSRRDFWEDYFTFKLMTYRQAEVFEEMAA